MTDTCPNPDCDRGHIAEPHPITGEAVSIGPCPSCGGTGDTPGATPHRPTDDTDGAYESLARVGALLDEQVRAHAQQEFTNPVLRAVFIDRGGHAPGEACALDEEGNVCPEHGPYDLHCLPCGDRADALPADVCPDCKDVALDDNYTCATCGRTGDAPPADVCPDCGCTMAAHKYGTTHRACPACGTGDRPAVTDAVTHDDFNRMIHAVLIAHHDHCPDTSCDCFEFVDRMDDVRAALEADAVVGGQSET